MNRAPGNVASRLAGGRTATGTRARCLHSSPPTSLSSNLPPEDHDVPEQAGFKINRYASGRKPREATEGRLNEKISLHGIGNPETNGRVSRYTLTPSHVISTDSPLWRHRIAVKDNICHKSWPTTCASALLRDYISPFNATVVEKVEQAGGFIYGKTNLDEFGMGSHTMYSDHGKTTNPMFPDESRSAGGSSGGSAVAVASKTAWAGLGTDTGGSVRLPAAFCGIVGFKPSYGLVSRYGVIPFANSLDTVGVLGREVAHVRKLYSHIEGPDSHDPTCLTVASRRRISSKVGVWSARRRKQRPLRIGVPLEYRIAMDEQVKAAWVRSLEAFSLDQGVQNFEYVPISLPTTQAALSAYYIIAPAEASSNLAKYDGVRYGRGAQPSRRKKNEGLYSGIRWTSLGAEVRRRILLGTYCLSSTAVDNYFIQAQKVRRLVVRDFDRAFAMSNPMAVGSESSLSEDVGVDFMLVPTAPMTAPTMEEAKAASPVAHYASDTFTVPASLAGLPAVSVPVWPSKDGAPIGMQIIGQYGDDDFVLEMAQHLEQLVK